MSRPTFTICIYNLSGLDPFQSRLGDVHSLASIADTSSTTLATSHDSLCISKSSLRSTLLPVRISNTQPRPRHGEQDVILLAKGRPSSESRVDGKARPLLLMHHHDSMLRYTSHQMKLNGSVSTKSRIGTRRVRKGCGKARSDRYALRPSLPLASYSVTYSRGLRP